MVFSSTIFLFLFLPITLLFYYLTPARFKNAALLLGSLVFYFWGSQKLILLLLISIVFNYLSGRLIASVDKKRRKLWLCCGITGNLALLFYFKYFNFGISALNEILDFFSLESLTNAKIILPIGISFFTFQAMTYLIDLYMGKVRLQKNLINFSLYISLFPQLIAGPIVRYKDIVDKLEHRINNADTFLSGVSRFIQGLGKKIILANGLGEIADQIFSIAPNQLSITVSWLGIICYSFQIYFDFSGYSDMAIGLGRMFGFDFPENFNYPYVSRSITEFWRRWHITLSTWFRDYLYIPLGGNRISPVRTYLHLWLVFLLCGLWHGASYNFLIWGVYHGVFIVAEKGFFLEKLQRIPPIIQNIYTLLVVAVGWVFFRAETLTGAISYLGSMAGAYEGRPDLILPYFLTGEKQFFLLLAVICSIPSAKWIKSFLQNKAIPFFQKGSAFHALFINMLRVQMLVFIFAYSVILMSGTTYNPFIYFRF